ncbi:MAG TPA: mismatch-specific DNA-glycosylase [Stellaceae bacterium]|jgi:TDG/mug DNA glycosylase family protein
MILPDVLDHGLDLVLCGTAPSRASKEAAAYYAHPGNLFWRTLFETGLTPVLLRPAQYREVLRYRIGLTDLCKYEFGSDAELSRDAFDADSLRSKIELYRPAAIAFDSKTAARGFLGRRDVGYGAQPERIGDGISVFVVPSPSGRARSYWDVAPWHEIGAFVAERRRLRSGRAPRSPAGEEHTP